MEVEKICMGCMKELQQPGVCPYCGYNPADAKAEGHYLRLYTILNGKYLAGKVIGEGGFGITYIGYDLNLEMPVAIKEFYPNGFVTRESGVTNMISMYRGTNLEAVQKWKSNFIKEARTLAKCSNLSGIVGVKDFFEENGTAYIVMEYLDGMTLKNYAKSYDGRLDAGQLLKSLESVMSSLAQVHEYGLIHRDISPDNIMLLPGGQMKLLDFGAARDYSSEDDKSLSVMLKPGYAPEEQYRSKGKQGPWSDVYAFAATIYKCITGVTPPESMERMRQDELKKPSDLGIAIPHGIEQAILKGMEIYAENRYQSMGEFMEAIYTGNQPAVQQTPVQSPPKQSTQTSTASEMIKKDIGNQQTGEESVTQKTMNALKKYWIFIACVAVLLIVIFVFVGRKDKEPQYTDADSVQTPFEPAENSVVDEDTVQEEEPDPDEEMRKKAKENITYGKERLEEGDYDTAILYFSEALSNGAVNDEEIYSLFADAYLGKDDIENAVKMLDMGIEQTGAETLRSRKNYLCDRTHMTAMELYKNGVIAQYEEYDTTGNITVQEYYDNSGNLTEWGEYTYWSGLLSFESHYFADGTLKWYLQYDDYGRESEYVSYNKQGELEVDSVYMYEGSLLNSQVYYDEDGNVKWWKDYKYDQNGQMIRDVSHNPDGSVSSWQEYDYDENGNGIYTAGYRADGSKNSSERYERDEYGNMTKIEVFDSNDNFEWSQRFSYEYDPFENPIKRDTYYGENTDVAEEWDYIYSYEYTN